MLVEVAEARAEITSSPQNAVDSQYYPTISTFYPFARIAAFAFSAWAGLAAFYREAQRRARAENELQEVRLLREGEAPSRPPSGPPQTDLPLPRVVATPTGDLEVEEVDEQTARRVREAGADDATDEVELTTTSRFEKKDN